MQGRSIRSCFWNYRSSEVFARVVPLLFSFGVMGGLASGATPRRVNDLANGVLEQSQSKEFRAKYEVGTEPIKSGRKLQITLGPDRIEFRSKKGEFFNIPLSSVQTVFYDRAVQSRALEVIKHGPPLHFSPYVMFFDLVFWGTMAGVMTAFESKDHFVHVAWTEHETAKLVVLELSKKRRLEFLDRLTSLTGKEWKDLPKERQKMRQELKQYKHQKIDFELPSSASVWGQTLQPGRYQLVLAERREGPVRLYFCAGSKVKLKKLVAFSHVKVEADSAPVTGSTAVLEEKEGQVYSLVGIRLPGKLLRLISVEPGQEFSYRPSVGS